MSKGLIFFCCACAILVFTIINLSVGPVVSGTTTYFEGRNWGTLNCKRAKDIYDADKESGTSGDALKYGSEWDLHCCETKKGMHDMEYTSFIFNIVIGFVCGLLGLLHLFDLKKEYVSKTGIIGLGCGIVGFIFSFVYVILNGLVYTNYYDTSSPILKRDSDGVFAEKKGSTFELIYFDSANIHALYAKYSDLIQKQYNYDKDFYEGVDGNCIVSPTISLTSYSTSTCPKLYASDQSGFDLENKDISDRFLTALLLSLFVCLANIGLGIFGFLLFRTPGDF